MRLVQTSLGKKLALQSVDGGPESADRLPLHVLYGLRGQNCTEKLIAAAICTPVYESALLVGIGQEERGPTVDALQDKEDRPQTSGDEGPLFGRVIGTRTGELTQGKVHVGIFADAVRNVRVFSLSEVSVKLRCRKDGIDEDHEAEFTAQVAHNLP
jgi:hypothetical protein